MSLADRIISYTRQGNGIELCSREPLGEGAEKNQHGGCPLGGKARKSTLDGAPNLSHTPLPAREVT